MYLQHFSLHAKPFELLPDPGFLFPSAIHRKALAYLEYGMQERAGFILVTGEVGAGKTTIIRSLLEKIPAHTVVAKVFNTQVDSTQLIRLINEDFGIAYVGNDKAGMLHDLTTFLIDQYAAQKRSVLIIDEAQNLSQELLEEVRLLSNLETSHAKLLQIVLVGQPELRDILNSPALIQLRQRILVHCHIAPLTAQETEEYVLYRLEQAGNRAAMSWQTGSLERIYEASRGVPRLINILCDYLLLDAYSTGRHDVSAQNVSELLTQLDFETQFWPESKQLKPVEQPDAAQALHVQPKDQLELLTMAVSMLSQRLKEHEAQTPDLEYSAIKVDLETLAQAITKMSAAQKKLQSDIYNIAEILKMFPRQVHTQPYRPVQLGKGTVMPDLKYGNNSNGNKSSGKI